MSAPRADFLAALAAARAGLARLQQDDPDNGALASAARQLAAIAAWTSDGGRPSAEQVAQLSVGVIAAREIEPLDMTVAEQIHAVTAALDRGLP